MIFNFLNIRFSKLNIIENRFTVYYPIHYWEEDNERIFEVFVFICCKI